MKHNSRWMDAGRIDFHNHVWDKARSRRHCTGRVDSDEVQARLEEADRHGIECLCISRPVTSEWPSPDDVRLANDVVLAAMAMSDRFVGFCFLNPGYMRDALTEIERCIVDGGMLGIKLYHQYFICDPALTPVMERAAELGVPVLAHAGKLMDPASRAAQPRISDGSHFVQAATMFPETILVEGHIGGGGDWEWCLRHLEARPPNLYLDTGGSVADAGMIARSVATLGADHVLFATDGSFNEGVGKVLDAGLNEVERALVFAGNARRIFNRRRV